MCTVFHVQIRGTWVITQPVTVARGSEFTKRELSVLSMCITGFIYIYTVE